MFTYTVVFWVGNSLRKMEFKGWSIAHVERQFKALFSCEIVSIKRVKRGRI